VNNLPKVVAQQRHGRASNPRLLDRKSDALPLKSPRHPLCGSTINSTARSADQNKRQSNIFYFCTVAFQFSDKFC